MSVNDCVPSDFRDTISLRLDQLPDILSIICRCGASCRISRHDVKDAYKNIPLCHELRKYYVIKVNNCYFVNLKLCFGDSTACHYFSRQVTSRKFSHHKQLIPTISGSTKWPWKRWCYRGAALTGATSA